MACTTIIMKPVLLIDNLEHLRGKIKWGNLKKLLNIA